MSYCDFLIPANSAAPSFWAAFGREGAVAVRTPRCRHCEPRRGVAIQCDEQAAGLPRRLRITRSDEGWR